MNACHEGEVFALGIWFELTSEWPVDRQVLQQKLDPQISARLKCFYFTGAGREMQPLN